MTDIVERIDKLIKGWEREYGITNETMVDARDTIIRLRSGPGGIMEMKQTIADKEAEIEHLEKVLDLVYAHDSNLIDHLKGWK